jgi:hypothetical protein
VTGSRKIRCVGQVTYLYKTINAYKHFVEIPQRKRKLGRLRRRCEDIRVDLKGKNV